MIADVAPANTWQEEGWCSSTWSWKIIQKSLNLPLNAAAAVINFVQAEIFKKKAKTYFSFSSFSFFYTHFCHGLTIPQLFWIFFRCSWMQFCSFLLIAHYLHLWLSVHELLSNLPQFLECLFFLSLLFRLAFLFLWHWACLTLHRSVYSESLCVPDLIWILTLRLPGPPRKQAFFQ